ncbi:MAG: TetR/AcrR family transcriptional regulator [Gammaproteobacteria bacterium]|nr:TetR/AcrR family transcriptional regulator [Gammaproteobacteria bacterium]
MSEPRYQRRKQDRPQEITAAAFDAFAENGYAATRVEEVARRAGVSKGLMYLYFKTKEELFKAVVKSVVVRRVDALIDTVEGTEMSSEAFIRGPVLDFMKRIPDSPVAVVIRLLISEGQRYPDLVDYYYENVVSRGLAAITRLVERGVERGEFKPSAVTDLPHLFVAPVVLSVIWRILFSKNSFDTDRFMETQINLILTQIKT